MVVSNLNPNASKTRHIDCSMAFLSMPFSAMVMPMTVPRKPVMGIAQTITRNRARAECAARGVNVGEVYQLIVQALGAAAPPDIFDGGPQAAEVTILLRLRGAHRVAQQVLALGLDRLAAGAGCLAASGDGDPSARRTGRRGPPAAAARPPGRWRT